MSRLIPAEELMTSRPRQSLDGVWEFSYDPRKLGVVERWFVPESRLPERTCVPGCPQVRRHRSAAGGTPNLPGTPDAGSSGLLRYPCSHDAWFKRRFDVPDDWQVRGSVWLHVGGVRPAAAFWINGHRLGYTTTSRSAVRCDISRWVRWGVRNVLAMRVTWPKRCLEGVHDWIGWTGIYRSCWIESVPTPHLTGIGVRTGIRPPCVTLTLAVALPRNAEAALAECRIRKGNGQTLFAGRGGIEIHGRKGQARVRIAMPGAGLWSPDSPCLYRADIRLLHGGRVADEASIRFGLREIRARGHRVLLNGIPIFLRGGCDDQFYPQTLCPPADKAFFRGRIRKAKSYGFNYTKSCVETFPKEFLDAADELGYLVCQEMPFGLMPPYVRNLRFAPPAWFENLCKRELANIVRFDRNHPSVALFSMASELDGRWLKNPRSFRLFSQDLPGIARALQPNALVFDCTGDAGETAPVIAGSNRALPVRTPAGRRDTDLQSSALRSYGEGYCPLTLHTGLERVSKPFVLHEYSWITCLSDLGMIRRYRRLPMRPLFIPDMLCSSRANGVRRLLPRMIARSRRLKYELRKDALEQARRDPKIAGYHHWLIQDFPFCAEGVFNDFWEMPSDLTGAQFRMYNDNTVLVLEDRERRSFRWGQAMPLGVRVSHFGRKPLRNGMLHWVLKKDGRRVDAGRVALGGIPCGAQGGVPDLGIVLPPGRQPAQLTFVAELRDGGRAICRNYWNLRAFPAESGNARWRRVATRLPWVARQLPGARLLGPEETPEAPSGVLVADGLDGGAVKFLSRGGRVLYVAPANSTDVSAGLPRATGEPSYRSVPFGMGMDGNMGTLVRSHPSLGGLPHDGWCDFCFAPLIQGAHPFALKMFGSGQVNPVIRSIGHMRTMEDKAYLFDLAVGKGTLLACSLRLGENVARDPLARYLLFRMADWLAGTPARPQVRIEPAKFRTIQRRS